LPNKAKSLESIAKSGLTAIFLIIYHLSYMMLTDDQGIVLYGLKETSARVR
jgi:hypothetical protein